MPITVDPLGDALTALEAALLPAAGVIRTQPIDARLAALDARAVPLVRSALVDPIAGRLADLGIVSAIPAIVIPTTNLRAVYSLIRVNSWAGPCLKVQRSSDNAQLDIGFVGNIVDKAAADAFAAGTTLTIVTVYDQSGNGLDLTQATNANRPLFSPLNEWRGIRPLTFDGFPTGASPKFMDTPVIAGIDRQAVSVYQVLSPRCSNQQCQYWEGFSDTGFATSSGYLINAGGSMGTNFGSFTTNNFYPRAHLQTVATISNGTNVRFRFDGVDKTFAGSSSTSAAMQVFRFGKLSLNGNYHSTYDGFFTAIYAQADAAAANLSIENALNASFNPDRAASNVWTRRLIEDGNSLGTGYFATALQNSAWQGGFGRGPQGNVREWEYYNMGIGGVTLASQYAARTRVTGLIDPTKAKNIVVVLDPTNDIANTTYTSAADAQTGNVNSAQNLYNNYTVPYVQAALAAGANVVLVNTTIPRTGYNITSNWRESARLFYNNLVTQNAAANGYVPCDVAAIPRIAAFDPAIYASDLIHLVPGGYALAGALRKSLALAA